MRRPGGGRKKAIEVQPELLAALDSLVEPESRGDPMSPLRWTLKSTRRLAAELAQMDYKAGVTLVRDLLAYMGYSLQAPAKQIEGSAHPDRDGQFRYINERVAEHLGAPGPVMSVDTKKKELVGNYDNGGREWQPKGQPERVNVHDFADPEMGKAIPYGVYDTGADEGWVSVGKPALVEVHSENMDDAAPTYKGGFGFGPMLCFADATGEALAARLRPGNAAANNAADHLAVLDDAIDQLPTTVAAGHRVGDPFAEVERAVMVRTDSAGCTAGFVAGCRARNTGFAVVARSNNHITAAISRTYTETKDDRWTPAVRQNGEERPGAQVAELTDLVDPPKGWPDGVPLIVRREPLHDAQNKPATAARSSREQTARESGHPTIQNHPPAILMNGPS